MKLIRITTTDPQAIFDNTIQGELLLKPRSRIALQSLTLEQDDQFIVIDDTNDTFTWSSQNGQSATITFPHQVVSYQNFQTYLDQFTRLLNDSVDFDNTTPYNSLLAMEWQVALNQKQKIQIEHKKGVVGEHQDQWTLGDDVDKEDSNWAVGASVIASMEGYQYNMLARKYTSKGVGFVRCQLNKAIFNAGGDQRQGVLIGLSRTDLSQIEFGDFTENMVDYGLLLTLTGGAGGGDYKTQEKALVSASFTDLNYVGEGDADNDYMEVMKTGTEVIATIYRQGGLVITQVIATDIDSSVELFPFVVFHADEDYMKITKLRTVVSPFENLENVATKTDDVGVGAPPMPSPGRTNNFINFVTQSLAEFLGYNNIREPRVGATQARDIQYIADKIFKPRYFVQSMIIEMLNMKLESYDGFPGAEKRKSILAFIPTDNQERITVYEQTQNFIDLNNEYPILLRNIQARIVQGDYSPINLIGQASMVLLVDSD